MKIKFFLLGAVTSFLAVFVLVMCNNKNNEPTFGESYKEKLIDKNLMAQLDANYAEKNYQIINKTRPEGSPDSKEYWYSIEELEGYIAFVKKEAANKDYKIVGMKIKMGQYPEKEPFDPRLNPKYLGYQAVYLVPTGLPSKATDEKSAAVKDSLDRGREIDGIAGMDLSWTNPPY